MRSRWARVGWPISVRRRETTEPRRHRFGYLHANSERPGCRQTINRVGLRGEDRFLDGSLRHRFCAGLLCCRRRRVRPKASNHERPFARHSRSPCRAHFYFTTILVPVGPLGLLPFYNQCFPAQSLCPGRLLPPVCSFEQTSISRVSTFKAPVGALKTMRHFQKEIRRRSPCLVRHALRAIRKNFLLK